MRPRQVYDEQFKAKVALEVSNLLVTPKISEAAGKSFDHPLAAINISQQQTTRIGSDVATLKSANTSLCPSS